MEGGDNEKTVSVTEHVGYCHSEGQIRGTSERAGKSMKKKKTKNFFAISNDTDSVLVSSYFRAPFSYRDYASES